MYSNDLSSFLCSLHLEDLEESFVEAGVRTVDDIARICEEEDAARIQELMNNVDLELLEYINIKNAIKDMKQRNQQQMSNGNTSRIGDAGRFPSTHMEGGDIKGMAAESGARLEQTERRPNVGAMENTKWIQASTASGEGNRAIPPDGDVVMQDVSNEDMNNSYISETHFVHDIQNTHTEPFTDVLANTHENRIARSTLNAESHLNVLREGMNNVGRSGTLEFTSTAAFTNRPLSPPHSEESSHSVQQTLFAEINNLLQTNWNPSAHLDAESNSQVEKMGYQPEASTPTATLANRPLSPPHYKESSNSVQRTLSADNSLQTNWNLSAHSDAEYNSQVEEIRKMRYRPEASTPTATLANRPLSPPHYKEDSNSVQRTLLAEIDNSIQTNWNLSAHLDAEYNSQVEEIRKMRYRPEASTPTATLGNRPLSPPHYKEDSNSVQRTLLAEIDNSIQTNWNLSAHSDAEYNSQVEEIRKMSYRPEASTPTAMLANRPLPPPHYEESSHSVQRALLAKIDELRVPLQANWDLSAHLEAEYNSHVKEIGKIDYQLEVTQTNYLELQAEEQGLENKIRIIQREIGIFHEKLPQKRIEVHQRMLQDIQSRRELLRKLTALVIIQQRSLSLLTHMHACEKRNDDHQEKARKEAGKSWDTHNEEFVHLVEDNERLVVKRRQVDDKADRLLLKLDELKAKIVDLEQVAISGAIERARHFKEKQKQQEILRKFRTETEAVQKEYNVLAGTMIISGNALEKQWDAFKNRYDDFVDRINAHSRTSDIALNALGDKYLKPPDWDNINLQVVEQTIFKFKSSHSDLKSITCNPSDFTRHDKKMSYRFALKGRWDNGDFRCVYHVRDHKNQDFVGKVFILRRGLEKDFSSAERSLKTLLLAEAAAKAFERCLSEALRAIGDVSFWEFSFVTSMLAPIRDPMPGSSDAENGVPKMTCMMIEEKLPAAHYTKYMSGFGVMKETQEIEIKRVQEVLDAFSHWSWYVSGERFMGIHIVANDLWDTLGHHCDGNYRRTGVNEYFSVHKCGRLCKQLSLPST
ncbi:hypothetical protein BC937DRAFT_90766 [Endogone sp. FLAS-F59071]|nr:hypothetical protein BC937DRAFT_90766 [Endogone sp. FLAS-F59071]|eukprot:RUS16816.1 hypothetical protein BC937DRAFT_90766 [Endogone sp. FLAS-F59071]